VCVEYVKSDGSRANSGHYPYNPNGSYKGVAGLTSEDGRHMVMMPHPERSFQYWQWPCGVQGKMGYSPWIQMFQNVMDWSKKQMK